MRLCIVSSKECWQDPSGIWHSYGGFPLQMDAIASLFDAVTMVVVRSVPRRGGMPLPRRARIVALPEPPGAGWVRKLAVGARLPRDAVVMARHMRDADVVHVPLPGDLSLVGMLTAIAMRRRCIARYGGSWTANSETTVMNRVTRACMRAAARAGHVMLATGDPAAPADRGVDWLFASVVSRDELAPPASLERGLSSPPQLAYLGRLSPEKGVIHLIRAMTRFGSHQARPRPELTVIGDGPERGALEQAARHADGAAIRFVGQLPREEVIPLLRRMDLCVQPSLSESLCKAWLDAMAQGLPVISSDVGAARAVFGGPGERGWLVPPGDSARLAEAIHTAITIPIDWPALRARCRDYAQTRTIDAWAGRIAELCATRWGCRVLNGRLAW
ncbi:MAG TPA: glycosyltransferase [Vicinamibacterales bacterium]